MESTHDGPEAAEDSLVQPAPAYTAPYSTAYEYSLATIQTNFFLPLTEKRMNKNSNANT